MTDGPEGTDPHPPAAPAAQAGRSAPAAPAGAAAPDHGAAAERTRLAWRRTGLAAAAVALLAARPAFAPNPGVLTALVTAASMAGWAAMIALAYRRTRGLEARPPQPGRRTVTAYALITVGFALIGGLVVTI
jgi:uncharacterized membrane protein YidH (DUF202 family)